MSGYQDPTPHLFWLGSRAVGIVALLLISASVGLGLAMAARLVRAPGAPARVKGLHEALALAGMIAIVSHGLLLLGDSYLHPGIAGIALPFALADQPIWTPLGIIAGWLSLILGLSFYLRRWIGARTWRALHRWTLLVYVLGVAHTVGSGTDGRSLWLLGIVAATALPILFLATYRFLPGQRRRGAPARPADAQPAGRARPRGRPRPSRRSQPEPAS